MQATRQTGFVVLSGKHRRNNNRNTLLAARMLPMLRMRMHKLHGKAIITLIVTSNHRAIERSIALVLLCAACSVLWSVGLSQ